MFPQRSPKSRGTIRVSVLCDPMLSRPFHFPPFDSRSALHPTETRKRRTKPCLPVGRNQQLTNVFQGPGGIIAGPKTLRSAACRREERVQSGTKNQRLTNVFVSDFSPKPIAFMNFHTLVANLGGGGPRVLVHRHFSFSLAPLPRCKIPSFRSALTSVYSSAGFLNPREK